MSDVVELKIKGDKRVVKAKLKKLTDSSAYFEAMFSQNFKEKAGHITVLQVQDIMSFDTLQKVVKFASLGQLSSKDFHFEELIRAADFFQMDKLKEELAKHVTNNKDNFIRLNNVLDLWKRSHTDPETALSRALKSHVLVNFESLLYDIEFGRLSVTHLMILLGSDRLLVSSERVVLQAIKLWINYDYDQRTQYFDRLLPLLRFQDSVNIHEVRFLRRDVESYCSTATINEYFHAYDQYARTGRVPAQITVRVNTRARFLYFHGMKNGQLMTFRHRSIALKH